MKRQDVKKAAAVVFGVAVLAAFIMYQTRNMTWTERLAFLAFVAVALFLLWREQKKDPGVYANFPKSHEMGSILGLAWGRRRRGAANPHRVSSEDATPVTPRSFLARETRCPTCDAPQLTVGLICRQCGALVNPAWVVAGLGGLVLFFLIWMWRLAHP